MFKRGLGAAWTITPAASTASGLGPPVPPSEYKIHLPQDQYRHVEAPTEWWWHIGTLKAGDRIFGFEINAAGYPGYGKEKFAFTQVMLSDVANAKHYQKTTLYLPPPGPPPNVDFDTWAETDPTKAWKVGLGDSTQPSYVSMNAPQADPTRNMRVAAHIFDQGTDIDFQLNLSQQGKPFMVFGTGLRVDPKDPQHKNYYYSLTRLEVSGAIRFNNAPSIDVTGTTWMDHEYGYFGTPGDPVKWILQNAQLDNGWHLMNFVSLGGDSPRPTVGTKMWSNMTLQDPQGNMYYLDADQQQASMTPTGRTWKSPTGNTYFLEYLVEILDPACQATLTVVTLMDDQEFPNLSGPGGIYEGVAVASGTFLGQQVSGTAWNEQLLK
ncbi:MAG: lipocalin-like domain-containing protein [Alphaproteobacteria bacterium]